MTTTWTLTGAALAAAACLAAGPAQAETKLKFATFGAANNPIIQCGPQKFLDGFAKASNGAYGWDMFLGATGFAAPAKAYEQVAKGVTDVSWGLQDYTPGKFPLSEVIGLPFLVGNSAAGARAVHKLFPQHLAKEYGDVHVIALPIVSPYQVHMRSPIEKLEDLKGKRVRAAGKGVKEALEILGATVVSLPAAMQYENLQKGVIDGSLGTWASLVALKVVEVTSHHLDVGFASLPVFFVMNKKAYGALPANLKAYVDGWFTADKAAELSGCWTAVDARAKEAAAKAGHPIKVATAAEREAWRKRIQPAIDETLKESEAKGAPVRAFYDALRAAIAAEEKKS